jgi:glucose-1-phosphate cytidylyltransferase
VVAYPYKGYWTPADTVKERAKLEEMYYQGNCPWMVWDPERSGRVDDSVPALSDPLSAAPVPR